MQLKLRNFCMRPARRIRDTGRASSVPYISRRHRRPRIYNKVYFIDKEKAPSRALVRNFYLYAFGYFSACFAHHVRLQTASFIIISFFSLYEILDISMFADDMSGLMFSAQAVTPVTSFEVFSSFAALSGSSYTNL